MLDRIVYDPAILGGKPIIRGIGDYQLDHTITRPLTRLGSPTPSP